MADVKVLEDYLDPGHPEANFKVPVILDHHRNGRFTGRKGALATYIPVYQAPKARIIVLLLL